MDRGRLSNDKSVMNACVDRMLGFRMARRIGTLRGEFGEHS
jgi:hypothetical protein